ncbi:MAG: sodium:solute symporter family protein [Pirellulales bacterium]|nr:sodium:solute symporter family protein [Pirellulales bacterium]
MINFYWPIDGTIVGVYLLATMVAGLMVRKYVHNVDDFIVAGRAMDLHLGIASLAATEFGIVTCMYAAQNGYEKGFAGATPGILMAIAMYVVGATGFCIEPLRTAGVSTIPELFEKRFGLGVRWASGVVIVLGGMLNMGVFLRIGGEFLVFASGLSPDYLEVVMTALLVGVAAYTILGGMLSVLVTDYLQFVVMSVGLVAVTLLVLFKVGWNSLVATVETNYGAGGFNPLVNETMGVSYVLFNAVYALAVVLTWQTVVQRVLAAKDSITGRRVFTRTSFFFVCRFLIPSIWGIAALATVGSGLAAAGDSLYAMPKYLSLAVPTGVMGLLIAAMLAADMSTDAAYMLCWSSVIYNDILAPFRRRRDWSQRVGLLVNRALVGGIGIFLLLYGLWYPLKGDLWSYLTVTGSIYVTSMSVLLIASCYWPRANNWGAAAAIACGAIVPITYLILEQLPATHDVALTIGPSWSGLAAFALTGVAMILGSLLKETVVKQPSRLKGAP